MLKQEVGPGYRIPLDWLGSVGLVKDTARKSTAVQCAQGCGEDVQGTGLRGDCPSLSLEQPFRAAEPGARRRRT